MHDEMQPNQYILITSYAQGTVPDMVGVTEVNKNYPGLRRREGGRHANCRSLGQAEPKMAMLGYAKCRDSPRARGRVCLAGGGVQEGLVECGAGQTIRSQRCREGCILVRRAQR